MSSVGNSSKWQLVVVASCASNVLRVVVRGGPAWDQSSALLDYSQGLRLDQDLFNLIVKQVVLVPQFLFE